MIILVTRTTLQLEQLGGKWPKHVFNQSACYLNPGPRETKLRETLTFWSPDAANKVTKDYSTGSYRL